MSDQQAMFAIAATLPDNPNDVQIQVNEALVEMYYRGNLEIIIDLSDLNGNYIKFQHKDLD
tara:strand:+ start:17847 stop:18029 length:183 start_codon:yes stop_codon:yes gene_type:complete